jgi:hypothetical protein
MWVENEGAGFEPARHFYWEGMVQFLFTRPWSILECMRWIPAFAGTTMWDLRRSRSPIKYGTSFQRDEDTVIAEGDFSSKQAMRMPRPLQAGSQWER